jgi:chromate reductase
VAQSRLTIQGAYVQNIDVAVLVGSLRQASLTRKMARALIALAPAGMALQVVEIGNLPLYNEELEPAEPAPWAAFRKRIKAADAVLFLTPEYNRGIPGALKNAVDVGSRPWGHSVWNAKPAAVMSLSPGALGAFGAHHHLRQVIMGVNMLTMAHPEAYIGSAATLFNEEGALAQPATREFAGSFLQAFHAWISRCRAPM